ncbi:MAG: DegV family EDD domain-containing protein [Candidatus Marinimicrobia bacterium]|nr:DegV family EDD domain-containing protein [Candidatus Neomarinimicrobiota bacterium]
MRIKYIDGNRFSRAIAAGAKRIFDRQHYLNKINVFPVPDADTGTNMASTLKSIVESISNIRSPKIYSLSKTVADSALLGARGNSGVILAQYFYGISEELKKEIRVTTEKFGEVVKNAVHYAYEALTQPKEGTILTVIKDWAESVYEQRFAKTDFVELLNHALESAKKSLKETTNKLEILKSSKVVDAGGQGFVDLLEGIKNYISKGKIKDLVFSKTPKIETAVHTEISPEDIKYQYCTECLIEGENININELRKKINDFGDSIVIAGSPQKARLHIHTNRPADVFSIARHSGSLLQQKADDMFKQYQVSHKKHPSIALVTDSACDLPQRIIDKYDIHIVPVRVSFGHSTYIDKITITPEYFYEMLKNEPVHPTTSQPPPSDFKNLYGFLLSHYDSIISIHLTAASSGTYQNAVNAAKSFPDRKITVIDGKSLSVTLGFVVQEAARLISEGKNHDEVVSQTIEARPRTQLFVNIPSLKYLMKSGRVSKAKGLLANLLHLKPILNLDENGVPQHCNKSFSYNGSLKKVFKLVKEFVRDKKNLRFIVAHATAPEAAQYYVDKLRGDFGVLDIPILPVSPTLGAHAGPGTAAIGITWNN